MLSFTAADFTHVAAASGVALSAEAAGAVTENAPMADGGNDGEYTMIDIQVPSKRKRQTKKDMRARSRAPFMFVEKLVLPIEPNALRPLLQLLCDRRPATAAWDLAPSSKLTLLELEVTGQADVTLEHITSAGATSVSASSSPLVSGALWPPPPPPPQLANLRHLTIRCDDDTLFGHADLAALGNFRQLRTLRLLPSTLLPGTELRAPATFGDASFAALMAQLSHLRRLGWWVACPGFTAGGAAVLRSVGTSCQHLRELRLRGTFDLDALIGESSLSTSSQCCQTSSSAASPPFPSLESLQLSSVCLEDDLEVAEEGEDEADALYREQQEV
jgi:hypothetical protein